MALLVGALVWLGGVGLGLLFVSPDAAAAASPLPWAALALPLLAAAALACGAPLRLVALGGALLLLGWARGLGALPALATDPLRSDYGPTAVRGVVAEPATPGETSVSLRLDVAAVERGAGWEPADGLLLVRLPRTAPYDYGDALELRGTLTAPPDTPGSGYGAALRRQGVRGAMDYPMVTAWAGDEAPPLPAALFALRRRLESAIQAALPEPHAALLVGIVLGGSATMPADFRQDMRTIGLSHVTAVSGFNVTLVAAALAVLAGRLVGRRAGWPLAALGIVFYTLLVGAPPSAARAAVMAALALAAEALGRPRDGLAMLVLAAALLAGWDPFLLADLGFQLSVLATAGLVLLQPALQARLGRLPAWAAEGLSATLAAQAFVLPLQLTTFHALSPVAPLANLLVVPLLPPLMALGLLLALVGLVAPALAVVVGLLPWAYLELIVRAVQALAALPVARLDVGALAPALGALYAGALLGLALAAAPEASDWRARLGGLLAAPLPRAAALAVVVVGALAVLAFAGRPDGRLRVAVLDVGQGDATLIRTPNGRVVLVDGGPSPAALMAHLGSRLGLAERQVHLVALTHPHEDHVAGLMEVLERYAVDQVVEGATQYASSGAARWHALLAERGIPTMAGASGQRWQLDDGVWLDVYAVPPVPGSRADAQEPPEALVLRLRYGATSLLLPGDLMAEQGKRILAAGGDLRATALLVPHHGSRFGLDPELFAAIQPSLAVISDGERNRFGHPAPLTLRLLEVAGIPYWRTDRDGTIELTSDGATWTVQPTEKRR